MTTRPDPERTGVRGVPRLQLTPRLFAGAADAQRGRRATDVISLLVALLLLAGVVAAADPLPGFGRALMRFVSELPAGPVAIAQIVMDILGLAAVVLVVATAVRQRSAVLRDQLLAAVFVIVGWLLLGRIVEGAWPGVWEGLAAAAPPPKFPAPRLAVPAAILLTTAPHLTTPIRRLQWWLVGLATVGVLVSGAASPFGAVGGLLVAIAAAKVVHLIFGSSAGRPSLSQVEAALAELNVEVTELGVADRQRAGYFRVFGRATDGRQLTIKVYGRDAHDAALVATVWRTVWYREAGAPPQFGRRAQVEHEAFLTLLAAQAGIVTERVVVAGITATGDALLVLEPYETRLAQVADTLEPTALNRELWALRGRLLGAGIVHGVLDADHILVAPGATVGELVLGVRDFRGAAITTAPRPQIDGAQLLVTAALLTGYDAAVDGALEALGTDGLAAILPFIQTSSLTPAQRGHVDGGDDDATGGADPVAAGATVADGPLALARLRRIAAARIGVEMPALHQLRRVTVGSVIRVVLPIVAVVALVSQLSNLDFSMLWEHLRNASVWLVLVAFAVQQLTRIGLATATLGSSPVPLALGPVYALHLAIAYVNVAIPSTAARIAVMIRFFQRHGVPPGTALAAGALDGFSGLIVQVILLVTLIGFGSASLDLDLGGMAGTAGRIALVLVIIVAAVVVVFTVSRTLRERLLGRLRTLLSEALDAVRGLHQPRRFGLLFGGNLSTEVLGAASLGLFATAIGYPVGFGELLLISIGVGLLSGVMPVPGGIGVAEAGLTFGLVLAGLPEEAAFSVALLSRISSFYLPPLWGFPAMRWLERHQYL